MRGLGLDRVLAGTAIALVQIAVQVTVLATGNFGVARAESPAQDLKAIEALVPLPEPADVPPPTIADIAGLPMPEPAIVGTVAPAPAGGTEPAPAAPAPAATVSTPAAGETPAAASRWRSRELSGDDARDACQTGPHVQALPLRESDVG